jgi:hypothetical protein
MVAPPEVPRNAESAQSEGRAEVMGKSAAKDSIKAGAPPLWVPKSDWGGGGGSPSRTLGYLI